ncbi:MAG TPA: cell division/cell wall cluster transcriptional repressor MraZ [Candidatus Binatia bacterium]|nr:cell division/cell wall cluster transcriptional repressor MraZ [Candidatus Binatia bacterium]
MFYGEYSHAVDAKGRTAVPSAFRPQLAAGAVVSMGAEGRLVIWPEATWTAFLLTHPITAGTPAEQRAALRPLFAGARDLELDGQGRLLLHPAHRRFASIGDRVTFVGMGQYIEVCSTERWEEETRNLTPEIFTELTDRINPLGFITQAAAS